MKYLTVTSPKWSNAEHSTIDCMVDFDELSEKFVPFTATEDNDYPHSNEIFSRCVSGDFGVIAEYYPAPEPTIEELAIAIRSKRNTLLAKTDWTQSADVPQATKDLWTTYRQSLRDITTQMGFPQNVTWPIPRNNVIVDLSTAL